ncbi:hypothetical protein RIF29_24162 [Crotalaria pallida]|uniref:F-box domain-containing protein n=1 Tax=Crotalaria pallida TaxID=3830 RepID=A0AAN9I2Z5_CROPI
MELENLPEDCIASIISFTTPRDACAMSLVSSTLTSAAHSDIVWDKFIPSEYITMIPSSLSFNSKKDLYLYLSQNPILIDNGQKSFVLEKMHGKKCYMLSARSLFIVWGDTPCYWEWISLPNTRFPEVAELIRVCWFEIKGMIKTSILSPKTLYGAYLVFKPSNIGSYGFDYQPVEAFVGIVGEDDTQRRSIYLRTSIEEISDNGSGIVRLSRAQIKALGLNIFIPRRYPSLPRRIIHPEVEAQPSSPVSSSTHKLAPTQISSPPSFANDDSCKIGVEYPKERKDGWWEVELGDFFNKGGEEKELEMGVHEVKNGNWKSGIILLGIEIRPKL